jgi:hypothetical protein
MEVALKNQIITKPEQLPRKARNWFQHPYAWDKTGY